jgi:hypothetical protein
MKIEGEAEHLCVSSEISGNLSFVRTFDHSLLLLLLHYISNHYDMFFDGNEYMSSRII